MQKDNSILEQQKDDFGVVSDLGVDLAITTKGIGEGLWRCQRGN